MDTVKLLKWQQRLKKLKNSGLSVAAFCRQEEISAACFSSNDNETEHLVVRVKELADIGPGKREIRIEAN